METNNKHTLPLIALLDTGCGKTTVVDILSIILHSKLQIINCHATTETSDLIGGLRPVRGRNTIVEMMLRKVNDLLKRWPDQAGLAEMDIPEFLNSNELSEPSDHCADAMDQDRGALELPEGAVADMIALVRSLWRSSFADLNVKNLESPAKRQKLKAGDSEKYQQDGKFMALSSVVAEIEDLFRRYSSLFEWVDGPVAEAMKSGHMLLLDELSLAEDAVLERLNSVLEPTRTLVLAEKGEDVGLDSEEDTRFISGHDNFRIFATMNPGGDYGKRELSPALRSRFTEIWVPAVDDMSDIELVLCRSLAVADEEIRANGIIQKMLAYVDWFNNKICSDKTSPFADLSLSLRDVLAWAQFIIKSREANQDLDLWNAYCHGAALMHLDGLGLGTGLAVDQTRALRTQAQEFLFGQAPSTKQLTAVSTDVGDKLDFTVSGHLFGVHPFWVQTGRQQIRKSSFNFAAPRTADNVFRVLRAMQLPKPILLEGKTQTISHFLFGLS